jgi:hypothetical protein
MAKSLYSSSYTVLIQHYMPAHSVAFVMQHQRMTITSRLVVYQRDISGFESWLNYHYRESFPTKRHIWRVLVFHTPTRPNPESGILPRKFDDRDLQLIGIVFQGIWYYMCIMATPPLSLGYRYCRELCPLANGCFTSSGIK